ncbi:hypothetical protein B0H12DRAFT_781858 [Mycena haematopus]|nr:hypothetical protein B0H12DRAFT_781858 [Mycena haematopus]
MERIFVSPADVKCQPTNTVGHFTVILYRGPNVPHGPSTHFKSFQMGTNVALDRASLIAIVMETFFNGVFTTLFAATLPLILKKTINNSNRLLLPTLCLIWVLSISHWILDIIRVMQAFLDNPAGAIVYYADVANPLEVAKTTVYVAITMTGDFFLIFRCFMVWNRKWVVVIIPILLWLGTGVTGYAVPHGFVVARRGGVFLKGLNLWITSFFAMSLTLNIICTTAIAYRIIRTRMDMPQYYAQNGHVYSALIIFLESAGIYSSSLLILLVIYTAKSNAQYIMLDVTTSLIGLTFSMILLRLAMAKSQPEEDTVGSLRARAPNSYPLTNVTVSRLVEISGTESFEGAGKSSALKLSEHDRDSV